MEETPLVIGIAGGSGSGKTTVTNKILARLDPGKVAVLEHDAYYKDLASFPGLSGEEINFDHPDSLETSLLVEHVRELKAGRSICQPVYDYSSYRRMEGGILIQPSGVIIIEGILIFAEKELREQMDIRIFVDTDDDERLLRRIRRDILERRRPLDQIIAQYTSTVKPMHLEFVEPSKRWADVIVPRGGENEVAIDMILAKIHRMME
jgi:uridine kinase